MEPVSLAGDELVVGAVRGGVVRDLPEVLLLVEDRGVGHVVVRVLRRLDLEEVLRVPEVRLDVRRRLILRREEAGERLRPHLDDGVRFIRVVGDGARVRVDLDLHRVPHVVRVPGEVVVRRGIQGNLVRVGVLGGGGVGVPYPFQAAVGHHQVGILVERQERDGLAHPRLQIAVDHDAAVRLDLARDQQVDVAEPPREERPLHHVAHGDPAASRVGDGGRPSYWNSGVPELTITYPASSCPPGP